jgi:hypothetical protein
MAKGALYNEIKGTKLLIKKFLNANNTQASTALAPVELITH